MSLAWASMVERMWEVGRRGEAVGVGEVMVIMEVEGARLWCRIWDSTAN